MIVVINDDESEETYLQTGHSFLFVTACIIHRKQKEWPHSLMKTASLIFFNIGYFKNTHYLKTSLQIGHSSAFGT